MGTPLYLTEPPQGPLVGQFILPGKIPAPLFSRPKGLDEGAGLPVIHAVLGGGRGGGAGVVTTVLTNPYLQEWLREPRPR